MTAGGRSSARAKGQTRGGRGTGPRVTGSVSLSLLSGLTLVRLGGPGRAGKATGRTAGGRAGRPSLGLFGGLGRALRGAPTAAPSTRRTRRPVQTPTTIRGWVADREAMLATDAAVDPAAALDQDDDQGPAAPYGPADDLTGPDTDKGDTW